MDIGICDDVKNIKPEKFNILIKILERHPEFEYKTKDMNNIKIENDKLNKKALKILIIKNNGSLVDISWRCAITGKKKSNKSELMSAMRSSIEKQIQYFKKINKNKSCELCGNINNLHVDHNDTINSAFDELVFNFVEKNNNIKKPENFGELNDETHRRCFLEKDKIFKDKWIKYHLENAKLRFLCEKCNLTRKKTKIKLINKLL